MLMKWRQKVVGMGICAGLLVVGLAPCAFAEQSSSPNYRVDETFFGSGGELNACSGAYCSKQSLGELGVGNSASSNYQAQGGFNTSDEPVLEVDVNGGTFDLDILDSATTFSTATTFSVRNYLSSGYVVRLAGSALTESSGGHTLTPMATAAAADAGTEQFGVNLRNNTTPNVGADPQQVPDSTFGFGAAATGYDTPDLFKFVDNDVVASSLKSSGKTLYTLSAIANVSTDTPAGVYAGHLSVIVIPTF